MQEFQKIMSPMDRSKDMVATQQPVAQRSTCEKLYSNYISHWIQLSKRSITRRGYECHDCVTFTVVRRKRFV
jgi:hypothetical protein